MPDIDVDIDGDISNAPEVIDTDNGQYTRSPDGVISGDNDDWEYRKVGDTWEARKKGGTWVKATGDALKAIKNRFDGK